MKRRDLTVTIALCASLVAHGLGMFAITENEIHELKAQLYQRPLDWKDWLARHGRLIADEERQEEVAQALPEPKVEIQEFEDLLGERGANGKGMNSSPGERPLEAPEAYQDQAALTRHPGQMEGASENGASGSRENGEPARPGANEPSAQVATLFPDQGSSAATALGVPLMPLPQQIPAKVKKPLAPNVIGMPRRVA